MALIDEQDKVESGGSGFSFNPHAYFPIKYVDNEEQIISFLTDWKRSLRLVTHFDKAAKRKRLCKKTYGAHVECDDCNSKDKELSRRSPDRYFLVYNHSVAADPVVTKDDGSKYERNPIQIYPAKQGENQENFSTILDQNGDPPEQFYDDKKNPKKVNPELLKDCALFFTESGQDKLWRIKKSVSEQKGTSTKNRVSYPPIAALEQRDARKILGLDKDKLIKVPDHIRDAINKLTLNDIAPHYLCCAPDPDWKAFELEPPTEGARIGDPVKEDSTNKDKAGAAL